MIIFIAFQNRHEKKYILKTSAIFPVAVPALALMGIGMSTNIGQLKYGMWIPIVIIGAILSIISIVVYLIWFKKEFIKKEGKGEGIAIIFALIMVSFLFSLIPVTTINYAFDGKPTVMQVEVIDKDIHSGSRTPTQFLLKVIIDGKEKEIDVPTTVYHSKQIGDSIEIQFYKGALGYRYYMYEYPSE